jgi:hypothetical protein
VFKNSKQFWEFFNFAFREKISCNENTKGKVRSNEEKLYIKEFEFPPIYNGKISGL